MTHFAVAVIIKDKNKLDETLKKYWVDLEVPRYV